MTGSHHEEDHHHHLSRKSGTHRADARRPRLPGGAGFESRTRQRLGRRRQRGQGFVTTIAGSIQPSQLPSVASRIVRSAVSFTVAESWGEPKDDGSRSGGYDVTLKNTPVKVSATSTMAPAVDAAGEATTVTVDVDLKVSVPLVGKTIEEKAMSMVGRVVADEERRATAWLAEH